MPEVNTVSDSANSAPSMAVPNVFEFDVFVSYSRKGRDFCALLEGSLRAYNYKPPSGLNLGQQRGVGIPRPAISSAPTTTRP